MDLNQLIKTLETIRDAHGGHLDVFDTENTSLITRASYQEIDPDDYPKDWRMPTECVFIHNRI